MIKIGDRIPNVTFTTPTAEGPKSITTAEIFAGKKVILVAVPGAFTPTCTKNHLPGFIAKADEIKKKGVDTIAFTAVNDVFVMDAWKAASGAGDKILFLADGSAVFAKAVGLTLDLTDGGLGLRSTRYAMIVEDGVVKVLEVEENAGVAACSAAGSIVEKL
jgi:peroxiredoxin